MTVEPPIEGVRPQLFGSRNVVAGYYQLESSERGVMLVSLRAHMTEIAAWQQGITIYVDSMTRATFEAPAGALEGDANLAWGLQIQLLGLGVGNAKAGLDALMGGYYSPAFGCIRHMIESFVHMMFVTEFPETAIRWYDNDLDQRDPPGMREMVDRIKAHGKLEDQGWMLENVYGGWRTMCKGAHPSGEGIVQTVTLQGFQIPPTYEPDLARIGFDHGLFAIGILVSLIAEHSLNPDIKARSELFCETVSLARDHLRRATDEAIAADPPASSSQQRNGLA